MDPESARGDVKIVLHVGCGARGVGVVPDYLRGPEYREIRLDLNPAVAPDILASITDMRLIADGSVDVVYSSHNLEHLYPHEVPLALSEFRRVLRSDGVAIIAVPDLQKVGLLLVHDRLTDPAYESPAGPITALDMLYGLTDAEAAGNTFMAHRTGFTRTSLGRAILAAGFAHATVGTREPYELWAFGYRVAPVADAAD